MLPKGLGGTRADPGTSPQVGKAQQGWLVGDPHLGGPNRAPNPLMGSPGAAPSTWGAAKPPAGLVAPREPCQAPAVGFSSFQGLILTVPLNHHGGGAQHPAQPQWGSSGARRVIRTHPGPALCPGPMAAGRFAQFHRVTAPGAESPVPAGQARHRAPKGRIPQGRPGSPLLGFAASCGVTSLGVCVLGPLVPP